MTWSPHGPVGHESAKIKLEVVPYMHGTVLDLGCGDTKVWPDAIGVDSCLDSVLFGTPIKPDVRVKTCEKLEMWTDASVDTVYSSHLLEHIVDYRAALAEWWRVLKPGGFLVLYLPHKDLYPNIGQPGSNPDHKHDFRPGDILTAVRALGGFDLLRDEVRAGGYEYSFLQVYRKRADGVQNDRPPVLPEKNLGIVRTGGFGDALWVSAYLPALKADGWHITVYTGVRGEEALRHDPHIDAFEVQPQGIFDNGPLQMAYWLAMERRHARFLNCVGAVERRLLPGPNEPDFYLPEHQRRRLHNGNYVQAMAEWIGLAFDPQTMRQRFYPTKDELAFAYARRAEMDGPVVVLNPAGSSAAKYWPHAQAAMIRLAREGVHSVLLGDLRAGKFDPVVQKGVEYGHVVGEAWTVRQAMAFAQIADVVVGTESALVNAVAYEPALKIVLLSHSSPENLTRDWENTLAVTSHAPCFPCHRIHMTMQHCHADPNTGAALCQQEASAGFVVDQVLDYLRNAQRAAA